MALKERTDLAIGAEVVSPLRSDAMSHVTILSSYIALPRLGKSDFEAINGGTSEEYHSEFKTDLDIERLPSGKFATNALILACAQLAYNILRWIGQNGLLGPDAPPRHRAKRRKRPAKYIYPACCACCAICKMPPCSAHRGEEHGGESTQSRVMAGVGQGLTGQWSDAGPVLRTPRHFPRESVAVAGHLRPGAPGGRRAGAIPRRGAVTLAAGAVRRHPRAAAQ